jgi:DNA end-binding protein Ku
MARPLWKGAISFGLVNVPVELVPAVSHQEIRFHELHDKDQTRLRQRMICPKDDEEVTGEHTVRGYEIAPDQYVLLKPGEIEALAPESSRALVISDFVPLAQIDPVYYERPYYLRPGAGAERAYRLLVEAMTAAGRVGIAKFVMHRREYLAALRPVGELLCLEIMRFADEVLPAAKIEAPAAKVPEKERAVAEQLIAALASDFEPARYKDEYRDQVRDLLAKKAKGKVIAPPAPPEEEPGEVIDLLAALEASVSQARQAKERSAKPHEQTGTRHRRRA